MNAYLLNCFPHIIDNRTNCCDVSMTEIICGAIVYIAIIAAATIFLCYIGKLIFNEIKERRQSKAEERNTIFKTKANYQAKALECLQAKDNSKYKDEYNNRIDAYLKDLK